MKKVALAGYINFVIAFVVGMVVARHVSPEQFGQLVVAFSIVQLLKIPFSVGLYNNLVTSDRLCGDLLAAGFWISLLQGMGVLLFACIFKLLCGTYLYASSADYLLIFAALNMIVSVKEVCTAKILDSKWHGLYFIVEVLGGVLAALLILFSLYKHWSNEAIVVQFYGQLFISTVLSLAVLRPWIGKAKSRHFQYLLAKAKSYIILSITGNSIVEVDKVVLSTYLAPAHVGLYSRATRFSRLFAVLIPVGVVRSVLPELKKMIPLGTGAVVDKLNSYVNTFLALLIPVALVVSLQAADVLELVYGDQWIEAAPVLSILMIGTVLMPIRGLFEQVLYAHGQPENLSRLSLWALLIYMGSLVLLTMQFSLMGAAVAILLHTLITLIGSLYFAAKYLDGFKVLGIIGKFSASILLAVAVFLAVDNVLDRCSLLLIPSLLTRSLLTVLTFYATLLVMDLNLRNYFKQYLCKLLNQFKKPS